MLPAFYSDGCFNSLYFTKNPETGEITGVIEADHVKNDYNGTEVSYTMTVTFYPPDYKKQNIQLAVQVHNAGVGDPYGYNNVKGVVKHYGSNP